MKFIKGLCWWIIVLVFSGLIMNYLVCNVLVVVVFEVNKVLNISMQQYGYIVVVFQVVYMVMQLVVGYVFDVLGIKLGFVLFVVVWLVVCLLYSMVGSWLLLVVFWVMLGMMEVVGFLLVLWVMVEWFLVKEWLIVIGWFNIGLFVGVVVVFLLVVWCILYGNWCFVFVVIGGIGLVWSVLWFLLYCVLVKYYCLLEEECDYICVGQEMLDDIVNVFKFLWGKIVSG